jgi:hypothetical protein
MNETASLQNLNDIVVPSAVPWWPLAPGWYVLAVAAVLVLAVFAVLGWRRWRKNRYRRQALAELNEIREGEAGALQQLPALLKRVALSAWPRDSVAALSGTPWHIFLDDSAGLGQFRNGIGDLLDQLAYGKGLSEPEQNRLLEAAEIWLRQHRSPGQGKTP